MVTIRPVILASQSQVRADMLREAGVTFDIVRSPFDEEAHKSGLEALPVRAQALALAHGKAAAVSSLYPHAAVIGADQICALGNIIFDKPGSVARAQAHLQALQGQEHCQFSAGCVYVGGGCVWSDVEVVTLCMKSLTPADIADYVARDNPLNACGGYCYEKHGAALFSNVDGSASAIKGLPLDGLLAFICGDDPSMRL